MGKKILTILIPVVAVSTIITIIIIAYFLFYQKEEVETKKIPKQPQFSNRCLDKNQEASYKIEDKEVPLADLIISVKNKFTREELISFKIENIFKTSTSIEIHRCGIYMIRFFNYDPKKSKQGQEFRAEFWNYQYSGQGERFFSAGDFSYDFRVDPTESYIVLEKSYLGKNDYSLVIKDLKTKQDVFVLLANEISRSSPNIVGSFNMREWTKDGKYFWGDIFDGADVLAFFRIERDAWKWKTFEAPAGTMGGTALNSEFGYITFDDGPPWTGDVEFSQMYKEQWLKEGKKVHFYLHNLFTKKQILLETVDDPLWNFKPQWLSDTELQYEMPGGEKRVYEIK